MYKSNRLFLTLVGLWLILFLGHLGQAELKMDGMTYSTVARNILETGQWSKLTFSEGFFAEWYQHPPLAFWIHAIVFKVFGATTVTVKIFNSVIALGSLLILGRVVFLISGSLYWMFLSQLVLLTTTRWVKFASDFYQDNLLSFFMLLGVLSAVLFLKNQKNRSIYILTFGLSAAAAFMTKGMASLVLPASIVATGIWNTLRKKKYAFDLMIVGVGGLFVSLAVISIWLFGFGGLNYMEKYWLTSVAYRLYSRNIHDHFVPLLHIMTVWWPWWPIMFYGTFRVLKSNRKENDIVQTVQTVAVFLAWMVVGGFTLVGHSIEFYFLPFYVFGAIVVGGVVSEWQWLAKRKEQFLKYIQVSTGVAALVLATFPVTLHAERAPEFKKMIRAVLERCATSEKVRIQITPDVGYIWYLLAYLQWETPWQSYFPETMPEHPGPNQLLVVHEKELNSKINPERKGWRAIPVSVSSPFRIYESNQSRLCRGLM
jgi:4-amino-4-deoxy-L-arabinose transferase-like glycosyltransferase